MPMKIALYVGELDIKGGTHKQVLRLAQYLVRQGHVVQVLTPVFVPATTFPEFAQLDVVALHNGPPKHGFERLMRRLSPVRLALKLPRVDMVNIHDNRGVLFFFTAWLLGRGRSYVWQINDLHPSFQLGNSAHIKRRWTQPIARGFNRLMARMVDRITVNVGKNVQRVREHLGVDADLAYCGVDLPRPGTVPALPPLTTAFRVLSTGVFAPYRNYERLIEACVQARDRCGVPVTLTIVGDTRYHTDYAQQVQALAASKSLPLAVRENLSDDELTQEIASCHAFAFVNIDQSWGLAVFETAARARPVVLSESVGATEILRGLPGFCLVDPKSADHIARALVALMQDPQHCKKLGHEAEQSVREMTWDKMYCSKIEQLFKQHVSTA